MFRDKKISAVIPALNEELSIMKVIEGLNKLTDADTGEAIVDDVVVCDNGSTDGTARIAEAAGARVVRENVPGYGAACLTAIDALDSPDVVVFLDADHSVVSKEVFLLLDQIDRGADLVVGSRVMGKQHSGALTVPQKFGNWLASILIRFLWKHPITDLGPFRAISYSALKKIHMQDKRFGWTVEMQVKAIQHQLKLVEVPVTTMKRIGYSKISGTIKGTIGAAIGIFGTIFKLWSQEKHLIEHTAENS